MNEVDMIKQMASAAGPGRPGAPGQAVGDVTDWVLRDIRDGGPQETRDVRLAATIGCVLAVLAVALAIGAWSTVGDPSDEISIHASLAIENPLIQTSSLLDEGNR